MKNIKSQRMTLLKNETLPPLLSCHHMSTVAGAAAHMSFPLYAIMSIDLVLYIFCMVSYMCEPMSLTLLENPEDMVSF